MQRLDSNAVTDDLIERRFDRLLEAVEGLRLDSAKLMEKVDELRVSSRPHDPEPDLQERFVRLAAEWRSGRGHSSLSSEMVTHPAYLQIIGMGKSAIPLLLNEMNERPDHWDWALRAITGTDPVPQEAWGKLRQIASAWLAWGAREGYIS